MGGSIHGDILIGHSGNHGKSSLPSDSRAMFLGVSDGTTHPETATEKTGPLGDKWVHL